MVFARVSCVFQTLVQLDRFADLIADGENRIERGHRLLEDHRDLVAADFAHLFIAELEKILATVEDFAADDFSRRRRDQPHDRKRSHALAAARLAHQPESLPSSISKLMPSMARTSPSGVKKEVWRFLTWIRSAMAAKSRCWVNSRCTASAHSIQHARVQNIANCISHSIKSQHCQHDQQPQKATWK